jgi:hypothetical protein
MYKRSGRTCNDALQSVSNLLLADLLEVAARCQDGCLVHQVLQVGTGEAGRPAGRPQAHRRQAGTQQEQQTSAHLIKVPDNACS